MDKLKFPKYFNPTPDYTYYWNQGQKCPHCGKEITPQPNPWKYIGTSSISIKQEPNDYVVLQ